jgi:GNAT superfamily N-acetyltransferase
MPADVSTRPERLPDDGDFLLSVYASTRQPELTGLGWPEQQQDAFIRMQFDAQTRHYRESFPDATYSVICVDGERAGRLIVNRASDQITIVDITLIPKFRGIGVGGGLVRHLLDQADADRLRVRCHVLHDSAARRFWERAGFIAQHHDGVYVAMERAPRGQPP